MIQDYYYRSEYKKYFPIAVMRPQLQLAIGDWESRRRDTIQLKIADLSRTLGEHKIEGVVGNLTEFKLISKENMVPISFTKDVDTARV